MSGSCFVDTNILVYAYDNTAGEKHDRARDLISELWTNRNGVISTHVLQELYVTLSRKSKKPPSDTQLKGLIKDYLAWQVVSNNADSILKAIDIQKRYQLSFWDSLIICAADESGAEILFSEDLNSGQKYLNVHAQNPLS